MLQGPVLLFGHSTSAGSIRYAIEDRKIIFDGSLLALGIEGLKAVSIEWLFINHSSVA